MVGRPKSDLDAEELLVEGPGGISGNLHAFRPLLFVLGLDDLVHGNGVTREKVCLDRGQENSKSETSSSPR